MNITQMNTECYVERIKVLENRIRELETADMWWDVDDGEVAIEYIHDAMYDAEFDTVYEFDTARRLPKEYIVKDGNKDECILRPATPEEIAAYKAHKKKLQQETRARWEAEAAKRQAARAVPIKLNPETL